MRGLYLCAQQNAIPHTEKFVAQHSQVLQIPELNACIIYSGKEWHKPPFSSLKGSNLYLSGWFIYKSKRNDLDSLLKDLNDDGVQALRHIEAGSFIALWQVEQQLFVINDPFGLSSHYIDRKADVLRIAPAVLPLLDGHHVDADMQNVLDNKSHLFGNFTLYDGIERLEPGSVTSVEKTNKYVSLGQGALIELEGVTKEIKSLSEYWPKSQRILPISSGMDSRLLLASGEFAFGFTYGPTGSPERKIAEQYRDLFIEYLGYEYEEGFQLSDEAEIISEISHGLLKPIPGLLANYDFVSGKFSAASAFFEGYLGDVMQRGTFVTPKGVKGELFKLFPFVFKVGKFSAYQLLKAKYGMCSESAQQRLMTDFEQKTSHLELSDYQKVTFYEFLYGRGGRYAIFGSNVLAAQCFSVISPFATNKVFSAYIHQDFADAVSYKLLRRVWEKTAARFKNRKVESGYSPMTHPSLIPAIQLFHRILFHLLPSRANYGIQLQRDLKKQNKQ